MPRMSKKRKQEWALFLNERNRIMMVRVWEPSPISSLPALTAFSQVWMVPSGIPNSLAALVPPISWASFTACTLYSWSYLRATLNTSLFSWFYYEILENRLSTLFIHHHTLKADGYPDVQVFMRTFREMESVVEQYNRGLAEWEYQVSRKPTTSTKEQHRPPEKQSVLKHLREIQERNKQKPLQRQHKESIDRDSR